MGEEGGDLTNLWVVSQVPEKETASRIKMADRRALPSEGVLTYAYILLYIALSSGQIFFNKVNFRLAPLNSCCNNVALAEC